MTKIKAAKYIYQTIELPIDRGGAYVIETKKDAELAVKYIGSLTRHLEDLKRKSKIVSYENDLDNARKALRLYQIDNDIKDLISGSYVSQLTSRNSYQWDLSKLSKIVKKRFKGDEQKEIIKRVTKRIINPAGIDELVKEGLLDADEIAPAYVSSVQTQYVQVKPIKPLQK